MKSSLKKNDLTLGDALDERVIPDQHSLDGWTLGSLPRGSGQGDALIR